MSLRGSVSCLPAPMLLAPSAPSKMDSVSCLPAKLTVIEAEAAAAVGSKATVPDVPVLADEVREDKNSLLHTRLHQRL